MKRQSNFRFSDAAREGLEALASERGVSKTRALEDLIWADRRLAQARQADQHGPAASSLEIPDFLRREPGERANG